MGNNSSAEPAEEDYSQPDQNSSEEAVSISKDNLLDLSALFSSESLSKALLNIKEPPGDPLVTYKEKLVKWLNDKVDKSETLVHMAEFVDHLTTAGCSREAATTAFEGLDTDREGTIDVTYCLSVLKSTRLRDLLPCPHLPGLIDLYAPDQVRSAGLHKALLQYLVRHRVSSEKLVMPALAQVNSTYEQRSKLVTGRCIMMEDKEKELVLMGGEEDDEGSAGERMILSKCYSRIKVSTNEKRMEAMFDNNMDTYWQSNGSPRSHWILVTLLPGVMVQELAISVKSGDDSYMPKSLTVSVGNSENSLKEVKQVAVPRHFTGRFVVIRNLASNYNFIQINIKGCHSDGCDCRVRGLHIKGCKYLKDVEPTVMDTMAIWYLNIIASTAKAAMPLSPALRDTIISQSKTSLKSLGPLSLSPTAPSKPEFFSQFVIAEMDRFLKSLCLPEENFVSVGTDPLMVLLSFGLAHGNVNTILDTLQIMIDNLDLEFGLSPLLKKMNALIARKKLKHAELLKLEVLWCDGGEKDEEHVPRNITTNTPEDSLDPYITDKDKKIVNILIKDETEPFRISSLKVKVQSSAQGARAGMLFLLSSKPEDSAELAKQTEKYNEWTLEDYKKFQSERGADSAVDELTPVAYFEPDKDSHFVEFTPDNNRQAEYMLFKFLASEDSEAERIGIHCVKATGYRTSTDGLATFLDKLESAAPLPSEPEAPVPAGVLLIRVLAFLASLLQDLNIIQQRRKAMSLDPTSIREEHLAVDGLMLDKVWSLYIPLTLLPGPHLEYASVLCLHVLKAALPFIKPAKKSETNNSSVPSEVLSHLCGLLDSTDTEPAVRAVTQDIIVEGVVIFFPDAQARKEYLLAMIGEVLDDNQQKSWWLKFEALCHYFSKTDSNSLLNLPKIKPETESVDTTPALATLTTMLTVAKREAENTIKTGDSKPDDLVKLFSALQSSLLYWCKKLLTSSENEELKATASSLITEYVCKVVDTCVQLLRQLSERDQISAKEIECLKKSLLGKPLPELFVFLSTMIDLEVSTVDLTNTLHPLVHILTGILSKSTGIALKIDSPAADLSKEPVSVVRVWSRESPHNYENNTDKSEEFVCSSATRFVLEFDPRCETERRYDFLEFTDSAGNKTKFDGEYGSDRWPKKAEFKGQKLHFRFHSDGSNNEWGYKFTVKAYGMCPPSLNWLFDAQVSLSNLLGLLSSVTLSKRRSPGPLKTSDKTEQEREEQALVDSEQWKTLFRGGYMVGKLTRSLSGAYAASPADSALSALLQDLASGPEDVGQTLLDQCRAETKGHFYGGPLVDKAVNSVFAALIWHSQDIREELLPFASGESDLKVTPGVLTAFKAAEAMRRDLVEARQKAVQSNDDEQKEEGKEKTDEDAPVMACHEKSVFLLKFSGLSRVKDGPFFDSNRPQWARKGSRWQKVSTAVSTVGALKQQLSVGTEREKVSEKYPSFDLVLNFVKNESLVVERIQALLQQRSKVARSVAQTYTFMAEVIRVMGVSDLFELPGLMFLQQVLARQQLFPRHYASKLDGCGLDLENQVRKSYRLLLTMLVEKVNSFKNPPSKEHAFSRCLVILFLTHLLDFEWQEYDQAMLSELQLPEFLFSNAIKYSVAGERELMEKFENEEQMLERYNIHMKMSELYKNLESGQSWRNMLSLPYCADHIKEAHLFLVRLSRHVDRISMQCDNCSTAIHGRWFRDMDEDEDFDLCKSCFEGEVGREKSAEHTFVSLGRFGCDQCKLHIIDHRFHSETRYDYDLCMGCFRVAQLEGVDDSWTVFTQQEIEANDKHGKYLSIDKDEAVGYIYKDGYVIKDTPASQIKGYVHQHCWMAFSSLCLAMAQTVNKPGVEVDYLQQASRMKFQCLKLLSVTLRAAVLVQLEKADKKLAEKRLKDKKLAEEKAKSTESKSADERTSEVQPVESSVDVTEGDSDRPAEAKPEEAKPEEAKPEEAKPEEIKAEEIKAEESSVDATDGDSEAPKLKTTLPTEQTEATPTIDDDTPTSEDTPIMKASRTPQDLDSNISFNEKHFVSSYFENILGLLTAILPKELNMSSWIQHKPDIEVFLAEELLPSVLQLSGCCEVGSAARLQTLSIAAQYFARLNPQVADRAIDIALGVEPGEEPSCAGIKTVQYFFDCGAKSLKESDFYSASTAENCLLLLSRALPWRPSLTVTMAQSLATNIQDMDLSSVFGLLVVAGFPKVPRPGCLLSYSGPEDLPSPVVLLKVEDKDKSSGVSVKSRERVVVKLADYEVEDSLYGCINHAKLDSVLELVKTALKSLKPESDRCVENTWILGLCLKALQFIIQSDDSAGVVKSLVDTGLIPLIVKLASKPTNFSQKWRLAELEVLGMSMYQPAGKTEEEAKEATPTEDEATSSEQEATPTGKDKESGEMTPEEKNAKILTGLSDEAQTILQTMSEVFMCELPVLRAMFESVDKDLPKFMEITEQCYSSEGSFQPSDEFVEAAKKWELSDSTGAAVDAGPPQNTEDMGVTKLVPVETDLKSVDAVPEDQNIFKKNKNLLKSTDSKDDSGNGSASRQESYGLLKEELTSLQAKPATRDSMYKTFHAIAVLQARRVLARLLVKWPSTGARLSTSTLGCLDMPQYFCLLDLLVKQEGQEILSSVLKCAEPTEVVGLVVTAVQCMSEVSVGKETREIRYDQDKGGKMKETGKIGIPSATNLNISFHSVNGSLKFSSNVELTQHVKTHTASSYNTEVQQSHVIPGDTVYYEIEMSDPENRNTLCSFSVNGTQMGRFDTGHMIVHQLLCGESPFPSLPYSRLWTLLIAVACKYTGPERLKVVKLLMKLVTMQTGDSGEGESDVVVVSKDRLELSALKPLWQLYTTLIKSYEDKNKGQQMLTPEIIRVFTELFLCVENLAEEWGISQELMIRTITKEELHKWIGKGICNVAYLSLGLGIDNTASSAFIKAKKDYVPPEPSEEKAVASEPENDGGETQSEDTEDSFDDNSSTSSDES